MSSSNDVQYILAEIVNSYSTKHKELFDIVLCQITKKYHITCDTCGYHYYGTWEQVKRNCHYDRCNMYCKICEIFVDCSFSNENKDIKKCDWENIRFDAWIEFIQKRPFITYK